MRLNSEQFTRMKEGWGFSFLHLMIEWEDLTDVPADIKEQIIRYVEGFSLNPQILYDCFRAGNPPGLFLYSNQNGTGKTSLVHMLAKGLVLSEYKIRKMRYLTGLQIFYELKKSFDPRGGIRESDVLDDMLECDVLFIDDLDKIGKPTEYEKKRFTMIMDGRYTSLKPVIITANKSIQEMQSDDQLEQHVFSRMIQVCKEIHLLSKDDFRLKGLQLQVKAQPKFNLTGKR